MEFAGFRVEYFIPAMPISRPNSAGSRSAGSRPRRVLMSCDAAYYTPRIVYV